jgi:hypothetical protein
MLPGNRSNQLGTANPDSSIFVAHGDPFVGYGKPYPWFPLSTLLQLVHQLPYEEEQPDHNHGGSGASRSPALPGTPNPP